MRAGGSGAGGAASLTPEGGLRGYFQALGKFSRNARLFLGYSLLSGLGTGIWTVVFVLYLDSLGFDAKFIGLLIAIDMLFHGGFALPAGLIGDRIGRRKTFIVATTLAIIARFAILLTVNRGALMVLSGVRGMGEGFHAVAGAPFMMENSEPEERPHLFSLNSAFLMFSSFVGYVLPMLTTFYVGSATLSVAQARAILIVALPLSFIALVPLALMREKPVELVESFADLFTLRNVESHLTIAKLVLCSLFIGLAFGFLTRFYPLFFRDFMEASDRQISIAFAVGSLGSAVTILLSPILVRRWGRVRSIFITQMSSIPFLLAMVLVPSLPLVVLLYIARGAMWSISMPLRNQLSMEFVTSKERATTAGLTHMVFDLPAAPAAMLAGVLIDTGNWLVVFATGALLFVVPAFLYYAFFLKMEERLLAPAVTEPA